MPRLYLMRHGQTQFNKKKCVQGRVDSPLTTLGISQAQTAASWFVNNNIVLDYACSSITGRAAHTCDLVLETIAQAATSPVAAQAAHKLIDSQPTRLAGLQERCYGTFEGKPMNSLPITPWEPQDVLVPFGGEPSIHANARMVTTLTTVMDDTSHNSVLAVSHGSVCLSFLKHTLPKQEAQAINRLTNCCILVFDFDRDTHQFAHVDTIEHDL